MMADEDTLSPKCCIFGDANAQLVVPRHTYLEVLGLKHHGHLRTERHDLAGGEAELLVVVEHRVHVLDPDRVDGAVEVDPLAVGYVVHLLLVCGVAVLQGREVEEVR